jgi:hypothetical protein
VKRCTFKRSDDLPTSGLKVRSERTISVVSECSPNDAPALPAARNSEAEQWRKANVSVAPSSNFPRSVTHGSLDLLRAAESSGGQVSRWFTSTRRPIAILRASVAVEDLRTAPDYEGAAPKFLKTKEEGNLLIGPFKILPAARRSS